MRARTRINIRFVAMVVILAGLCGGCAAVDVEKATLLVNVETNQTTYQKIEAQSDTNMFEPYDPDQLCFVVNLTAGTDIPLSVTIADVNEGQGPDNSSTSGAPTCSHTFPGIGTLSNFAAKGGTLELGKISVGNNRRFDLIAFPKSSLGGSCPTVPAKIVKADDGVALVQADTGARIASLEKVHPLYLTGATMTLKPGDNALTLTIPKQDPYFLAEPYGCHEDSADIYPSADNSGNIPFFGNVGFIRAKCEDEVSAMKLYDPTGVQVGATQTCDSSGYVFFNQLPTGTRVSLAKVKFGDEFLVRGYFGSSVTVTTTSGGTQAGPGAYMPVKDTSGNDLIIATGSQKVSLVGAHAGVIYVKNSASTSKTITAYGINSKLQLTGAATMLADANNSQHDINAVFALDENDEKQFIRLDSDVVNNTTIVEQAPAKNLPMAGNANSFNNFGALFSTNSLLNGLSNLLIDTIDGATPPPNALHSISNLVTDVPFISSQISSSKGFTAVSGNAFMSPSYDEIYFNFSDHHASAGKTHWSHFRNDGLANVNAGTTLCDTPTISELRAITNDNVTDIIYTCGYKLNLRKCLSKDSCDTNFRDDQATNSIGLGTIETFEDYYGHKNLVFSTGSQMKVVGLDMSTDMSKTMQDPSTNKTEVFSSGPQFNPTWTGPDVKFIRAVQSGAPSSKQSYFKDLLAGGDAYLNASQFAILYRSPDNGTTWYQVFSAPDGCYVEDARDIEVSSSSSPMPMVSTVILVNCSSSRKIYVQQGQGY